MLASTGNDRWIVMPSLGRARFGGGSGGGGRAGGPSSAAGTGTRLSASSARAASSSSCSRQTTASAASCWPSFLASSRRRVRALAAGCRRRVIKKFLGPPPPSIDSLPGLPFLPAPLELRGPCIGVRMTGFERPSEFCNPLLRLARFGVLPPYSALSCLRHLVQSVHASIEVLLHRPVVVRRESHQLRLTML